DFRTFRATVRRSCVSTALYTAPMPPLAIWETISYLPSRLPGFSVREAIAPPKALFAVSEYQRLTFAGVSDPMYFSPSGLCQRGSPAPSERPANRLYSNYAPQIASIAGLNRLQTALLPDGAVCDGGSVRAGSVSEGRARGCRSRVWLVEPFANGS